MGLRTVPFMVQIEPNHKLSFNPKSHGGPILEPNRLYNYMQQFNSILMNNINL